LYDYERRKALSGIKNRGEGVLTRKSWEAAKGEVIGGKGGSQFLTPFRRKRKRLKKI